MQVDRTIDLLIFRHRSELAVFGVAPTENFAFVWNKQALLQWKPIIVINLQRELLYVITLEKSRTVKASY